MLDPQTISELARQIATQQFLAAWPYWLLVLALGFVVTVLGSWIGAFAKIRGENFAKKADFDQLLAELQKQTEATERIKAIVEHATWLTQEWNRTRRLKLEQYLEEVTSVEHRLDAIVYHWLYGDSLVDPKPSPEAQADMLQALYFPEFEAEHDKLVIAVRARYQAAVQVMQARLALVAPGHRLAAVAAPPASLNAYSATYAPVHAAVQSIKGRSRGLMQTLASPEPSETIATGGTTGASSVPRQNSQG